MGNLGCLFPALVLHLLRFHDLAHRFCSQGLLFRLRGTAQIVYLGELLKKTLL
jgi:hypothetical protein